LMQRA